LSRHCSAIEP